MTVCVSIAVVMGGDKERLMKAWSIEELSALMRYTNAEVAEITGRSIEEVGDADAGEYRVQWMG